MGGFREKKSMRLPKKRHIDKDIKPFEKAQAKQKWSPIITLKKKSPSEQVSEIDDPRLAFLRGAFILLMTMAKFCALEPSKILMPPWAHEFTRRQFHERSCFWVRSPESSYLGFLAFKGPCRLSFRNKKIMMSNVLLLWQCLIYGFWIKKKTQAGPQLLALRPFNPGSLGFLACRPFGHWLPPSSEQGFKEGG